MSQRLVVTVLGSDRPGLVQSVSKLVAAHGGNWEASRMARLAGRFAGVLLVNAPLEQAHGLADSLRGLAGSGLQVQVEIGDVDGEPRKLMELDVVGHDRPGIISEVSSVLSEYRVNIDELDTRCESAPMAGHNLFRMHARVMVPTELEASELRRALEALAGDLMVDVALLDALD